MTIRHIKYLALGDSYTIGESVSQAESFPSLIQQQVNKTSFMMVSPTVIAMTGWTTDELNEAITAKAPASNFDLVTLLIGVNNQYRKRSIDTYALEFHELLKRAIGFANGNAHHVLVISIPDWAVTPFGKKSDRTPEAVSQEIDAFNAINKKVALQMNAQYIDITPISRTAAQDNTMLAEDGLHPSGKMYASWVSHMMPKVIAICND